MDLVLKKVNVSDQFKTTDGFWFEKSPPGWHILSIGNMSLENHHKINEDIFHICFATKTKMFDFVDKLLVSLEEKPLITRKFKHVWANTYKVVGTDFYISGISGSWSITNTKGYNSLDGLCFKTKQKALTRLNEFLKDKPEFGV